MQTNLMLTPQPATSPTVGLPQQVLNSTIELLPGRTINLGPSAIAQSTVANGPSFALTSSEWLTIQVYVNDGMALPTTLDALKALIGDNAPADMSDFTRLVEAYAELNKHVTHWKNITFPASVSLASDVHAYAQMAPIYYEPIIPLAKKLEDNPKDEVAKNQLTALLDVLSKSATTYHDNATSVFNQMQEFANQTQADKVALIGVDGKSGLKKYYEDKYGANSEEVLTLLKDIKAQQIILNAANKEYDHDVVVAATTPTYAWVFIPPIPIPIGLIAASVVAGVYGDKAVKALERARAAARKIKEFNEKLQADFVLMNAIYRTETNISNIINPLLAALPIIQKIQGVWKAIADDLNLLKDVIKNNIEDAAPSVMQYGVKDAIIEWTAVGAAADAYRHNAFIAIAEQ